MYEVKLTTALIAAFILSYALGMALSTAIPVEVNDSECAVAPRMVKESYTEEELERADAEMKKSLKCLRTNDMKLGFSDVLLEAREAGKWITWLPWLLVPLLLKVTNYRIAFILVTLLLTMAVTKVLLPIESALSAVAFIIGISVVRWFSLQANTAK